MPCGSIGNFTTTEKSLSISVSSVCVCVTFVADTDFISLNSTEPLRLRRFKWQNWFSSKWLSNDKQSSHWVHWTDLILCVFFISKASQIILSEPSPVIVVQCEWCMQEWKNNTRKIHDTNQLHIGIGNHKNTRSAPPPPPPLPLFLLFCFCYQWYWCPLRTNATLCALHKT